MRWWFMVAVLLLAGPVAEAGADSEAETEAGTDAGIDAATDADAARPPPKIATVVAGDPDETLRQTAAFIEQEATTSGLRGPTDPALRAAMRGEPAAEEDGLDVFLVRRFCPWSFNWARALRNAGAGSEASSIWLM